MHKMPKAKNKPHKKRTTTKYEEKTSFNGSFEELVDVMVSTKPKNKPTKEGLSLSPQK